MSHKAVNISLIAILSSSIAAYFYFTTTDFSTQKVTHNNQYDSFIRHLDQTQYGKAGTQVNHTTSSLVKHYPLNNYNTFLRPHFILHNNNGEWIIDADTGKSTKKNTIVYLSGHVTMIQPATKTREKTIINSTEATVYPQKSLVKIHSWVTINRPDSKIEGLGATAHLKTGVIKLLSHSRGHYASLQTNP